MEFLLPPRGISELAVQLYLRDLRTNGLPRDALVAGRDIYGDNAALLVDLSAPMALTRMWHLCAEALYLSPTRATIRTDVQQEHWQKAVDDLWAEDRDNSVLKIRWRPSRLGGRAWVTAAATLDQMRDARRRPAEREPHARAGAVSAEVSVAGSMGYEPQAAAEAVIAVLKAQAAMDLLPAASEEQLIPGTWRRVADADRSAAPGRLRLYLRSASEAETVSRVLHGKALQLGEDLVSIAVSKDVCAAAGRRGRRAGAPPPS